MSNHDYTAISIDSPGEYIREELDARGLTQEDLSRITGRPLKTINGIIMGNKQITAQTARELAASFGTSADLWMNLESQYRLSLADAPSNEVARRAALYEFAPIREMQKRGWLPDTSDVSELWGAVCELFDVADLSAKPALSAAMRASSAPTVEQHACRAWIHGARLEARSVDVPPFRRSALPALARELRSLVADPSSVADVRRLLNEAGIRFVVVPHLPKTRIDGAMFYLDQNEREPVLAVTLRTNMHDSFWFTLMHELAHLYLQHGPTIDTDAPQPSPEEDQANALASDWLLDREAYEVFKKRRSYSPQEVAAFAKTQDTHPDIVLGRLKKEGALDWRIQRSTHAKVRDMLA